MRLIYLIRLELLLNPRIKIEQVDSIKLKLDLIIILIILFKVLYNLVYFVVY